jgi:hypothetical protein
LGLGVKKFGIDFSFFDVPGLDLFSYPGWFFFGLDSFYQDIVLSGYPSFDDSKM